MCRSDGLSTSHPTFELILYNNKIRNQLNKLGSVYLNTKNVNPYITVDDLKLLWSNDDDRKKLQRKLFTFASNVPGTKPYWVSKRHECKSTSFFIHILIRYIQQFFIHVVLRNIMIVCCVFFHLNMFHVLMVIRKIMEI